MANTNGLPTAKLERTEIIPRIADTMSTSLRDDTTATLHRICDAFDSAVRALDKKLTSQNWTPAGREFAINEAKVEFDAFTQALADGAVKHAKAHASQLEAELAQVPEPNFFIASQIWKRLDAMNASEIDVFLSQSDDPQVLSAVMSAPAAFPYGSPAARGKLLMNYARAHKPEKVALLNDCNQFTDAVQNFRDSMVRSFKKIGG
jgi:hypothetical protein